MPRPGRPRTIVSVIRNLVNEEIGTALNNLFGLTKSAPAKRRRRKYRHRNLTASAPEPARRLGRPIGSKNKKRKA